MGLLDILNGMQNGPGGARQQQQAPASGMPTWMMALLGLLAYKAIKGGGLENMMGGGRGAPDRGMAADAPGGGLGDILGNVLGGGSSSARLGRRRPWRPSRRRAGRRRGGRRGLGGILGGLLGGGRPAAH